MSHPVLIVGAGPTGLTLGCELLRRGVACRIIDTQPAASPFSKALAIHARTLELFEKMGVVEKFLAQGWMLKAFNVFNRREHIVRMTFHELESPYPFVLSLPQSETERILTERLVELGGEIERGVTLAGLTQQRDGVEAVLSGAVAEQVRCRWLVGCDGAHSTVRHLLEIPFEGGQYQERYVLADVEFETTLDLAEFYIFSDRHRLAGFHPFSATGARIFADLDVQPGDGGEVGLADLQLYLDERGPGSVRLTKLNWLSTFFVHRRQARSYRAGRVFLAGDAAHVHSPASGQGMNVGIQDAFNLAWKLALVEGKGANELLLDSYGQERHSAGKATLRMTDFFSRLNTLSNPLAVAIRNNIGPMLSRNEQLRHRYRNAVAQLSVNYRDSRIVGERVEHPLPRTAPRPGERASDGPLLVGGVMARLFDLWRDTRHHLLILSAVELSEGERAAWAAFENDSVGVDLIVASPGGESSSIIDPDGWLGRVYGASPTALYLIRPDGYVAYRSVPASARAVRSYLERFLPAKLAVG